MSLRRRGARVAAFTVAAAALLLALLVVTTGVFGDSGIATRSDWTQLHPSVSPGTRDCAAATYDDSSGQVVMFGGDSSTIRNVVGTWSWKGNSWEQLPAAKSPPWVSCASMTYDSANHDVVMFGGLGGPQETQYSSKTWLWNGRDWSSVPVKTPPPGRVNAAMAYDEESGQVILFGGQVTIANKAIAFDDTWAGRVRPGNDYIQCIHRPQSSMK